MAATREGNRKSHQTLKERLGEVGYREHMAAIGAKGGKASVPKGFSMSHKQFNTGSGRRELDFGDDDE
jgi:general stress protein YciG